MLKNTLFFIKPNKHLAGILLMMLHAISTSALYILAKELMIGLHPGQVAFLYKFSVLLLIIPWCMQGGFKKNIKTKKLGMHITRGTFSTMGSLCFFYGLQKLPPSDASAITYLEQVIILCIGILYFKEQITLSKIIIILCGFTGALFVIKPGFEDFNIHYIYLFFALLFWAINNISIKVLGRTERTKAQLFYVMICGSVFSFPLALEDWQPIYLSQVKYIVLLAMLHLIHVASFFKALKFSEISIVMPFDYLRILFTGLFGYIILNEVPDYMSIIGYAIIMFGGIYLLQDEGRKKKFSLIQKTNEPESPS